jgi:class 3 adenylate cyclase
MSNMVDRQADKRAGSGASSAWSIALAAPMLGLAALLLRPELDLVWEHHPSHFWLVLLTAVLSVALAYLAYEVAARRGDARLLLVALGFLSSGGFLGLHALATPGVLVAAPNAGFVVATPVGLAIGSVFAAVSTSSLAGPRAAALLRHRGLLLWGLIGLMLAWAIVSLARLPPLSGPLPSTEAAGPLAFLGVVGVALFAWSAGRSTLLFRHRRSRLSFAMAIALALLAEAMIAVALSRNWHFSWWEWHLLMAAAFVVIAAGARAEYARTRSLSATFGGLYLEATLNRLARWHSRAIADLAAARERGEPPAALLAQLRREGASADELALLQQSADELARVDELFRPYLPGQLASSLRRNPERARLGGEERSVSVLFADLAGFTSFSEDRPPTEIIRMLNAYWEAVVPVIEREGGLIEHFAGDGVLVIFNALVDQPDHAQRAARAGLAIARATEPLARANPGWPRFRIGVNSGPAMVGNVGAAGRQSFAAIGDTTNLGSRLMSVAQGGQVVVSGATREALAPAARLAMTPLGRVTIKGKRLPVEAWVLSETDEPSA